MSLKYRIAVVIFLLEVAMMSVVFTTTFIRSQEINQKQAEENDKVIVDLVVDLSRFALFTYEFDDLQTYIEKITEDPHVVNILIIDRKNKISVSNSINQVGSPLPKLKSLPDEYWRVKEITNSSGILGKVAINFSNVEIHAAKKEVLILGIKVAAAGMLFIAIIGLLTGSLLTRRLELLSNAAKKIKNGHLDIKTNLKGGDELALLGQSFDGMVSSLKVTVDQLRSGEDELREARDKLESRVLERTSELATANKELQYLALHDPLTGLPNRILMLKNLHKAFEQNSFSVLMIDLNRFKEVNDTLGHEIGDELLIQVSSRISKLLRKSDAIARIGGDEFTVILTDVSQEQSTLISDKIVVALSREFSIKDNIFHISCSIGISLFPQHGSDSLTLLKCADTAMYKAKRNHLGHAIYDVADDHQLESKLSLHTQLRSAIDNDELILHYQPKVDIKTGEMIGVEALVRWQHKDQMIYPDKFIPCAEKTGLIREITKWVLKTAIAQQAEWKSMGKILKMSVNLSLIDLHDDSLVHYINETLSTYKVNAEHLMLEITETCVMEDPTRTLEVLYRLNEMGLNISIDDFGTGYSSMMYLKKLPVCEIKIDRTFVSDLLTNSDSLVIVRSIIDLAHNLSMSVTAEGVESQEVWDKLASLNCNLLQGYYIERPIPNNDLIKSPLFLTPENQRIGN